MYVNGAETALAGALAAAVASLVGAVMLALSLGLATAAWVAGAVIAISYAVAMVHVACSQGFDLTNAVAFVVGIAVAPLVVGWLITAAWSCRFS